MPEVSADVPVTGGRFSVGSRSRTTEVPALGALILLVSHRPVRPGVTGPRCDIFVGIDVLGARVRDRLDAGRRIAGDVLLAGLGRRDDDRALLVVQRVVRGYEAGT